MTETLLFFQNSNMFHLWFPKKKLRDWKCWGIKVYHNIKECTFAKRSFNQTEQNYVHQCIATSLVFGPGIHVNIFDLEVVWTTVRDNVWSRWTRDSNYCHWPQLWLLYIEKKKPLKAAYSILPLYYFILVFWWQANHSWDGHTRGLTEN